MVKIVEKGFRDCTVTLDGSECAVEFPANYRVFSAQNMSDGDIVMSIESGRTAEDDGVRIIEAGGCGMLAHMRSDVNTVYITGTGKVHISAGNEAVLPFKSAGKGGESINVSGEDNPVTLEGLQGGVPFAEMVVSGDDIIGRDLTVGVCGKNLNNYSYAYGKTKNGVTATEIDGMLCLNGTIAAKGTCIEASIDYIFRLPQKIGTKICLAKKVISTGENTTNKSNAGYFEYRNSNFMVVTVNGVRTPDGVIEITDEHIKQDVKYIYYSVFDNAGNVFDNHKICAQIEMGDTATDYEPYHGASYTITPDCNPYIVPDDIRQQGGLNNISVSAGELSVTGVRKNAAIKSIWDNMGMDLLFDGLAIGSSPAVGIDFSGYSKFVVSNYLNTSSNNCDFAGTVLIERDRLELLISSGWFLDVPISTSYSIRDYFSGTISDASFYAMQSLDASAQYFTRIYGIR